MSEKQAVFAKGLFVEKPSPKAPDFVIAKLSFKVADVIGFLQEHENNAGYINCDVLMAKDGQKYYAVLNQFEPKKPESLQEPDGFTDGQEDSGIPF